MKVNQREKNNKFLNYNFFPKNHKAVSGVIVAVIMIALVMAATVIVWTVVNNLIKGKLGNVESCFGIFEKITINSRYTCYNDTSKEFQFSINIGDIDVDKVIVSISREGTTNSFEIPSATSGLVNYPSGSGDVILPGKNSGLTYIYSVAQSPDLIKIAPIINGKQCEVSDLLLEIDDCSSLV
ncbi:MAG: hypothetical protein ACW98D_15790 [Promethearchaeota archaeon]|jgi:hypothetical protein